MALNPTVAYIAPRRRVQVNGSNFLLAGGRDA
jgi:hypothetical protein